MMAYATQNSEPPLVKKIQNYIFRFADLLGQGNFSKVYKAHNDVTGETVAIKIVEIESLKSKKLEELLYSEIEILKKLSHPNVLKCHEVFTSLKNCYIITELCAEGDLESKLRKEKYFDEVTIGPILRDVFAGLMYLTEKGVVHRDLKVANVFLHYGRAKLADFGFAKQTIEKFKDINIGSPIYMSPEGFINNIYGPKTDVWAFGVMIFELLHGETPFAICKTENELKYQLSIPLKKNRIKNTISSDLRDVILRCIEIDESKRINMEELSKMPYFVQLNTPSVFSRKNIDLYRSYDTNINNSNSLKRIIGNREFITANVNKNEGRKNRAPSSNMPYEEEMTYKQKKSLEKRNFNVQPSIMSGVHSELVQRNKVKEINEIHRPQKEERWQSMRNLEFQVLSTKIMFKECVNVLHYCRLIFKFILTLKMSYYKRENEIKELTKWLMEVLHEIKERINREEVIYEGESANLRELKLREVRDEYEKKYRKELAEYIRGESHLGEKPYELDFMISYTHALFQKYDELLYKEHNKVLIAIAHSIVAIYDTTVKLKKCYDSKNYCIFLTYTDIEDLLNIPKESINFEFYLNYKAKIQKDLNSHF